MSDTGTTAVQVSPSIPTESEMSSIRSIFDRAANAIVQASELAVKVEELVRVVDGLKADVETQRRRNQELDEMLVHVRSQRDKAEAELSQAHSEVHSLRMNLQSLNDTSVVQAETITRLREQLAKTEQAWDGACKEASDNYKRAENAEAKLADIQEFAQRLFPPKAAEPVTVPAPSTPFEDSPTEIGKALNEPQANEAKASPAEVDYSRPYHWDMATGKYVND